MLLVLLRFWWLERYLCLLDLDYSPNFLELGKFAFSPHADL
jgi:hypothetical protein